MESPSRRSKRTTSTLTAARLFNTDSPIIKQDTDLQTFISLCLDNWASYEESEKQVILSVLPVSYRAMSYDASGKIACPMSPDFVVSDANIRDQIAQFKRDIADGLYTKTWQERARKAMQERADGKFDQYLAKHAADLFDDMEQHAHEEEDVSSDGDYSLRKPKKHTRRGNKGRDKMSRGSKGLRDITDMDGSGD